MFAPPAMTRSLLGHAFVSVTGEARARPWIESAIGPSSVRRSMPIIPEFALVMANCSVTCAALLLLREAKGV